MQVSNFLRAHPRLVWAAQLLLALAAAAVGWLQLERSAGQENHVLLALAPQYILLGVLTVFAVPAVVYALCGRWHIATAAGGAAVTVLALVNYYVKMLHGTALMAVDIANAATAADVVGAYSIRPDPTSIKIGLCFLPVLAAAAAQWLLGRPGRKGAPPATWRNRLKRWAGCILLLILLFFGYFGPWSIMPTDVSVFAYAIAFNFYSYGYTPSLVSSALLLLNPVVRPAEYSAEAIAQAVINPEEYGGSVKLTENGEYPDLVVILNEAWYDLSLVTDPQADTDYMEYFYSLAEDATMGYALVPDVGGGTNRSEFSLLASHSMTLLPGVTPFSTMSMEGQPSVVTYVESLGYATMAAHPAAADNYRRGMAWPALGFDSTYFIDNFRANAIPYGNREAYVTDTSAYPTFISLYEAMPENQPRFAYLLTIQNHGDYNGLDESELRVRAATDFGDDEHAVDEFLSLIDLDDEALKYLTDYFTDLYRTTGRRVVLLMVGDHAPYLVDELTDSALTGAERTIRQRATPFVLWTNYPAETRVTTGTAVDALPVVDLCALLPMAAEQAGLPLSPYYRYLLAMRQEVSGWTNLDGVLLPDGSVAADGTSAEADEWVSGYYMLEYNALTASERVESLFLPETG